MKLYYILKTFKGCQDGIRVEEFVEGNSYELSDSLANTVMKEGYVKPVEETPEEATGELEDEIPPEEKAEPEAPENKAVKAAPSNKQKRK